MKLPAQWLFVIVLAGVFYSGEISCPAQQGRAFSVIDRFSFCPTNRGIFLPVFVQGKEYLFLLDTGTSYMVYDRIFRQMLGPAIKRESVRGTEHEARTNEMFNAPEARLGKISLRTPEPVLVDDLETFRVLSRLPVYGVIGMSVLGRHFLHLDFDQNEVLFLSPQQPGPPVDVPLEESPHPPTLTATLPSGPEKFLLDSGSEGFGALAPPLFDQLVRAQKLRVFGTNWVASFDKPQLFAKGRLTTITVLDREYRDQIIERSEPTRLGWAFITNYNWLVDMGHLQVNAEPRAAQIHAGPGR